MNGQAAADRAHAAHVTDRDVAILRDLFDSRILTHAQLAEIHFAGSRGACKNRLQRLKAARLVISRSRSSPNEPELLMLAKAGFERLIRDNQLSDFPSLSWDEMERRCRVSPLTLNHEKAVGHLKAAFHAAARRHPNVKVIEFLTWPRLSAFTSKRTLPGGYGKTVDVKADGFARVNVARVDDELENAFYIEVDRSTEALGRIVNRAAAYQSHYSSGNFAAWMGGDKGKPEECPFRVLWLFKSHQRLIHFAHGCLACRPPIRRMMWLAVFDEAVADPFGEVWTTPADCPGGQLADAWSPATAERIVRRPLL